jgi:hypothetical protein
VVVVLALATLFDRTWRYGEVFSPADLVLTAYPWAHEVPRADPANPTRSDEAFYHQPLMMTHWSRLRAGEFPQWDPWTLSGAPAFHHGLDVGRAFSPLSAPFYLLPPELAVTVYAPLRLLCAALLMWLYLRHARVTGAAAAVGAVAFAFNGAFLVWLSAPMPTVALWLPLIALGVERTVTSGRARDAALLSLGLGLQWLGAYLPTSLVVMAVTAMWAAWWLLAARTPRRQAVSRLAGGLLLGTALGAIAFGPMLATLADSPASGRSMREFTQPWQNLVTFALPDFWGSPLSHTWWYPGSGNYPELVTYLGVATATLAGAGIAAALATRDGRGVLAALVAVFALMQMYGWAPASWTSALPGLRQMNPYRWNVALAFATSVLAAIGLDAVSSRRGRPLWPLLGALGLLLALAGATGAAVLSELDVVRRLGLQAYERTQLARFAWLAGVALSLLVLASTRRRALASAAAWGLVALVSADLVHAAYGFNPTMPRDCVYPMTPGLGFLQREIGPDRIAPLGGPADFAEGHLWGIFGIPAITGFDFFGDVQYQDFLRRATGQPAGPPRWAHVGLPRTSAPDLRLLGLLGARLIVTTPVDVSTNGKAYSTLGELTDGRGASQAFEVASNGFRRVDVLGATFARQNEGTIDLTLVDEASHALVTARRVDAASLRDLDWVSLDFAPLADSKGRRFRLEIRAQGGGPGAAATLMATGNGDHGDLPGASLEVDGAPDSRALWIRTFASAPERVPGATQIYTHDLNVYRNPFVQPAAWFVTEAHVVAKGASLEAVASPVFDPARVAVLETPVDGSTARAPARVLRVGQPDPDRRLIEVDAPSGGLLVIRERFHRGWSLRAGSAEIPLVRADSVLMAALVPPGTRQLELAFTHPAFWPSLFVAGLALAGTVLASFRRR